MGTTPEYWEERAARQGVLATVKHGYNEDDMRQVTDAWWSQMRPLRARLADVGGGKPFNVLDFGCGFGRWHPYLSRIPWARYVGVDVCRRLVEEAKARNGLGSFYHIRPATLPFVDGQVDAVWCVTVLQHLDDAAAARSAAEIQRVLRPGAALCLTENTTPDLESAPHVHFRPAAFYREIFGQVALAELGTIAEGEEVHTMLGGVRQ